MLFTFPKEHFEDGYKGFSKAFKDAEKNENRRLMADSAFGMGEMMIFFGNFKKASKHFDEAVKHGKWLRDKDFLERIKVKRGLMDLYQGFMESAINRFFETLVHDSRDINAESFNYISWIYTAQNNLEKSEEYLKKAEYIIREKKDSRLKVLLEITKGLYDLRQERYFEALAYFNEGYAIARKADLPYHEVMVLAESSKLWNIYGFPKEGERLSNDACNVANYYGFNYFKAEALTLNSESLMQQGEYAGAMDSVKEAENIAGKYNFKKKELRLKENEKQIIIETKNKNRLDEIESELDDLRTKVKDYDLEKLNEILNRKEKELRFLLQKNRAAVQQLEELKELRKVVAHDLKEPLRNIGGFASLLKRRMKDKMSDEELEYAENIMQATERLDGSLTALLSFLSLTRDDVKFTAINAADLIRFTLKNMSLFVSDNDLEVDFSELENVEIDCDKVGLSMVFEELIVNAVKFKRDGETAKVKIRHEVDMDREIFYIEDNGIGIHQQYFSKIFILFHRLTREIPGYGIGLSKCRKIIQQHGGNLYVESSEGHGSTFYFDIKKY